MRRRTRASKTGVLGIFAVLLLASTPVEIRSRLTCPPIVSVGQDLNVDVHVENRFCSPLQVRMISTLVGNANETTGEVSILGPSVAERGVDLPAAIDHSPGTCISGFCDNSFHNCSSDADCACRNFTAGVADVSITILEPVPQAFDGTAAALIVASEAGGGVATHSARCLIAVPEPALPFQQIATIGAIAALLLRSGTRNGRKAQRAEFEEIHA